MIYIPRLVEKQVRQALGNSKVLMVLGVRQVGKTTMMERIVAEVGGVILNMDVEVDRARLLAAASLAPTEAVRSLGTEKLLVIDEAQRNPEVGRIVKGWYDAKVSTKVVLLGSSSLDLLDRAAESLTGRNEKVFLTPLLWEEVLMMQAWYRQGADMDAFKRQWQSLALQLVVFGGYPEAILTGIKEKYLVNLTSDYLLKDVLQSDLVKRPEKIKKLLLLLAYQVGSEVSVSELATDLVISRQTVEKYLELLERIFVIFRLRSFSTNPRKEIAKSSKIYFWDTGVRNALQKEFTVSELRSDIGALWENWVVAEVAKRNLVAGSLRELYFWRTVDGSEIDLVVRQGEKLAAFEIKWHRGKLRGGRSWLNRYGVKPEVITRENFWKTLPGF